MRNFCGLMALVFILAACDDAASGPSMARLAAPAPQETPVADSLWIVAEKSYGPDAYTDGTYLSSYKVTIPASLEVQAGNPGNGYAYLTFNYTRVEEMTCRYQGNRDTLYVLDVCSNASLSGGSEVQVQGILLLQIDNGDPSFGTTRIRARLPITDYN
jgi:hypothetical protein